MVISQRNQPPRVSGWDFSILGFRSACRRRFKSGSAALLLKVSRFWKRKAKGLMKVYSCSFYVFKERLSSRTCFGYKLKSCNGCPLMSCRFFFNQVFLLLAITPYVFFAWKTCLLMGKQDWLLNTMFSCRTCGKRKNRWSGGSPGKHSEAHATGYPSWLAKQPNGHQWWNSARPISQTMAKTASAKSTFR